MRDRHASKRLEQLGHRRPKVVPHADTDAGRFFAACLQYSSGLVRAAQPNEQLSKDVVGCEMVRVFRVREQEVLRSLAQGHRNKEIAAQLGVSVGTVKTHLRHIFRKLTVADRTAAVLAAV